MSERKEPHPFKTVRRLLRRIPDPRLRMAAIFAVFFLINLVAGRVVETVFDKESLAGAYRAQEAWIAKLKTFTPLELAKGYLADFGPAMRGEIIYKPLPPPAKGPSAAEMTAALKEDADRRLACLAARASAAKRPCADLLPAGETASACTAASSAGCQPFLQCQSEDRTTMFASPPECAGIGLSPLTTPTLGAGIPVGEAPDLISAHNDEPVVVPGIFAPVVALVRTVTRLLSGGAAAIVPIMQLGLGVLAAIVFMRDRRTRPVDGDGMAMALVSPVVVIALASAGALALKWLMIGALALFAGVTHFAASAAGATGFVGACWYCFAKLAEKGVEGAMTGKVV